MLVIRLTPRPAGGILPSMEQMMIVDVDRMEGGIIVSFLDGRVVHYSYSLLQRMIPDAEILPDIAGSEPED